MKMGSSQNNNNNNGGGWLLDYGLADEIPAPDYFWPPQTMEDSKLASALLGFDASCKDSCPDNGCSRKRARVESCAAPGTKACREKMRRDRLNERFTELCFILEPGRPPKADRVAVLSDAARLLNQLRLEAQELKESNKALQDGLKNLKAEKLELRDEKARLKAEKEQMEQMLKGASIPLPFILHPAAGFHPTSFAACNKSIPYPNYPAVMGMWRWIPPAALDTSQDQLLRPPVA